MLHSSAEFLGQCGVGCYSERARRIQRQQTLYRNLRRLVVPTFVGYGLYITRPREGHFIRYVAERSRSESLINEFLLTKPVGTDEAARVDDVARKERGLRWWSLLLRNRDVTGENNKSDSEDTARIANMKKLFAPSVAVSSGIFEESAVDRLSGPQQMHELSKKLWEVRNGTKAYDTAVASGLLDGKTHRNLPLRLEFDDWVFFATGSLVFNDSTSSVKQRRSFIGVCGMVFLGSTAGRKKRNRHLSNTGRIAAACALLAGYARQDLMDHIDITEVRELGGEVPLKTLNISIPFTSSSSPRNDSDGGTNGDSKTIGLSTSATTWLTKPVLDPWRICLCPIKRWVPDMQVTNCMAHECNVAFTMFNRRHHCRLCGRIFCFACCSNTVRVPSGPHLAASHYAGADNARGVDRMPLPNGEAVAREAGGRDDSLDQNKQNQPQQVDYTTMTAYRICTSCHYEIQLVIPRRDCNGEVRRKCRGELKMLQRLLLVRIVSYLSMEDLLKVSLVSSDFYFVSRDNVIWYRYNMTRCVREEEVQRMLTMTVESPNSTRKWRSTGKITRELSFNTDFDSITSADAAKPAISLHARYNFTQFLDFTRRREATRCKGLSCFSVSTRTLLSSPIKIALIGPSGVGKTMLMREWVQGGRPDTDGTSYEASVPAVPFNRFEEVVHLSGGLTADARLQVFDISGHPCFEELCRFICARCHIVVLCYDPRRRSSFVEAQEMMAKVDSALGAQPVVVCGISPPVSRNRGAVEFEVTKEEARAASTRERGSVQCSWAKSEVLFESVVQCLLDRIALGTSALPFSPSVRSSGEYVTHEEPLANRTVAQELLQITVCPSAIDILLN